MQAKRHRIYEQMPKFLPSSPFNSQYLSEFIQVLKVSQGQALQKADSETKFCLQVTLPGCRRKKSWPEKISHTAKQVSNRET